MEEACSKAGISVPPVSTQCESKDPVVSETDRAITVETAPSSLDGAAQTVNESCYGTSPTTSTSGSSSLQDFNSPQTIGFDPHRNGTAMGAISAAEDAGSRVSPQEEYYGSSSAASLMRLACESIPIKDGSPRRGNGHYCETSRPDGIHRLLQGIAGSSSRFQYDDFSLPPRPLADHLLDCFWKRVYCLYPFFHWPSFHKAYENLWCNTQEQAELSELNIGLGSAFDSNANPLVLYNALNIMFALGCHFSNGLGPEREQLARSFFHRSERLVCLTFLDIGSIGVVQVLLIVALYLQSTSYTGRCWFSIGIACRIAQGLGLHEATVQDSFTLLETEIRRRTWHGCVIIDLIVSMTFGRPSMTSHIPPVPLPSTVSDSELFSDSNCRAEGVGYSLTTFYVSTIELYGVLDSILCDIYNAWHGRSPCRDTRHYGLDIIIELDSKLSAFESNLPPNLNWSAATGTLEHADDDNAQVFKLQRNVLHARYLPLSHSPFTAFLI